MVPEGGVGHEGVTRACHFKGDPVEPDHWELVPVPHTANVHFNRTAVWFMFGQAPRSPDPEKPVQRVCKVLGSESGAITGALLGAGEWEPSEV